MDRYYLYPVPTTESVLFFVCRIEHDKGHRFIRFRGGYAIFENRNNKQSFPVMFVELERLNETINRNR